MYNIMASKCRVQNGVQHSLDKASYAEEIHTKTKKIDVSEKRGLLGFQE